MQNLKNTQTLINEMKYIECDEKLNNIPEDGFYIFPINQELDRKFEYVKKYLLETSASFCAGGVIRRIVLGENPMCGDIDLWTNVDLLNLDLPKHYEEIVERSGKQHKVFVDKKNNVIVDIVNTSTGPSETICKFDISVCQLAYRTSKLGSFLYVGSYTIHDLINRWLRIVPGGMMSNGYFQRLEKYIRYGYTLNHKDYPDTHKNIFELKKSQDYTQHFKNLCESKYHFKSIPNEYIYTRYR